MLSFGGSENLQFYTEKRFTVCLVFFLLELFLEGSKATIQKPETEHHLELGRDLLAKGELSEALTHYHGAVEGDPTNYLTYFKRGTVYLALGQARNALKDFSKALELNTDFTGARIQRGALYMKIGYYDEGENDLISVINDEPDNYEITNLYNRLKAARTQWKIVQEKMSSHDYRNAIPLLTQLIEVSPWSAEIRKSRFICYMKTGDKLSATNDIRSVNKLSRDNSEGYYESSVLFYEMGEATDSLKDIRECLKLDPEHKKCFPFYKKVKKVEKHLKNAQDYISEKDFKKCVNAAKNVLEIEKENDMIKFNAKKLLCSCYKDEEDYTEAIKYCTEALKIKRDSDVLCDRGEAFLGEEQYDDAIADFDEARKLSDSDRAKEGYQNAKNKQKDSEQRDYYKILGVKKSANKQEIVKAYRKAAQKWHPDNYQGEEKKKAEKKFIDIAAAKEVLTDPEKRRQFDRGIDPLNPENSQNSFRGNPFQHFHHDSPFQFKFHFN